MFVPTDNPHLIKDTKSGVVIQKNNDGYASYIQQAAANELKRKQMMTMEEKVENLESDMDEIKSMLRQLLEKK